MTAPPTPVGQQFMAQLAQIEQRLHALEHSQQLVFTDPTKATGDATHGFAVAVAGSLQSICGISAFGIAVWNGSGWTQLT